MNIEEKFRSWLLKQRSERTGKLLAKSSITTYVNTALNFMGESPDIDMNVNLFEITNIEELHKVKTEISSTIGDEKFKKSNYSLYSSTYKLYEKFINDGANPYSDFIQFSKDLRDSWIAEDKENTISRNEFSNEYTLENFKNMTLEEYAIGDNDNRVSSSKDSLCYKLERGKYSNNGSVRGGTSSKFGIYMSGSGEWKGDKEKILDNPEEYYANIKSRLVYFVESLDEIDKKYDEFRAEKYKALKTKIAYMLKPDMFIRIYSEGVVRTLAKYFDVDEKYMKNYCTIVLNREVAKKIQSIKECNNISYSMINTLIWSFHEEVLKDGGTKTIENNEDEVVDNIEEDSIRESLFVGDDFIDRFRNLLKRKQNVIIQGPPGTGKTYVASKLLKLGITDKRPTVVETIQFHQSYSYEEFIEGYRPTGNNSFVLKDGVFKEFVNKAKSDSERDYVLLIDEINRTNLSKVFGELMMLIEPDKRTESLTLPYSNAKFTIPKNIYIVGTMNTADRSISMVDYALRRRFAFIDLDPQFYVDGKPNNKLLSELVDDKYLNNDDALFICNNFHNLNKFIIENLGKGFTVGHSYFVTKYEFGFSDTYNEIIEYEVKPLLEEYFFDDQDKVEEALRIIKLNE